MVVWVPVSSEASGSWVMMVGGVRVVCLKWDGGVLTVLRHRIYIILHRTVTVEEAQAIFENFKV